MNGSGVGTPRHRSPLRAHSATPATAKDGALAWVNGPRTGAGSQLRPPAPSTRPRGPPGRRRLGVERAGLSTGATRSRSSCSRESPPPPSAARATVSHVAHDCSASFKPRNSPFFDDRYRCGHGQTPVKVQASQPHRHMVHVRNLVRKESKLHEVPFKRWTKDAKKHGEQHQAYAVVREREQMRSPGDHERHVKRHRVFLKSSACEIHRGKRKCTCQSVSD